MNPAHFALHKRTVMAVLTVMLVAAGIISYTKLGRLEDPVFTIKTALVATPYPGASPREVEEEVTDVIEEAIQTMGQVDEVYSTSEEGLSIVYVDMKDDYKSHQLPQIWDELRKKVKDAAAQLPPGAGPSSVVDDFGDVYGVFFALSGEGYTMAQLQDYAKELKKDLLLCDDVPKVELWGAPQEVIYVEFQRARLTELGISPTNIFKTLEGQNLIEPSGKVDVNGEYVRFSPTGEINDESKIADLLIGGNEGLIRLGEIAKIHRAYEEPLKRHMTFNGKSAIAIGISTIPGGNVVTMGDSIKAMLKRTESSRPLGMDISAIYYQSDIVKESVSLFVVNLLEAVGIVIGVLMIFMGWQSGLLIGFILILTILATFLGMLLTDIDLQKISLGALILALGMLVDNAIVVADGILVKVERGQTREEAAEEIVRDTQWPLLGATLVAILAFTAIGFAPGNTGEFCRSLFEVMAISLSLSWLLAVTVTPLLCVWFLKIPKEFEDPYDKTFYRFYRRFLELCLKQRWLVSGIVISLLVAALIGFGSVPKAFFPDSTQRCFYVNYWKPQGTYIEETIKDMKKIDKYISSLKGVKKVSSFTGEGTLRFILSYNYETQNSSYGQFVVEVDNYKDINQLIDSIDAYIYSNFPDSESHCTKVPNGPGTEYKIGVRFKGKNSEILKNLAHQTLQIMKSNKNTRDVRTDWRQPIHVLRPQFMESQARQVGVTRHDLNQALQWTYGGTAVGLYRERDKLIPIISRPSLAERSSISTLEDVQVWSSRNGTFLPLSKVVSDISLVWEDPLIKRRNRQKAISVECNTEKGLPETLRQQLIPEIENIKLPTGYTMEWINEFKDSQEAQAPLQATFPICMIAMFVTVVWLFNSVKRPIIIFMTVPLSLIGVVAGLLISQIPFGFMSILGFLGLSGMLIKNAIVLIDELELQLKAGSDPYKAILDSAVSRLRPVTMAAATTILGMIPLVTNPMYSGMSVTIMGGLFVGTFLTLLVVPVLYAIFYRVHPETEKT